MAMNPGLLSGLFALGLVTMALMVLFVYACDRV
jgi:hypothetical protein